MATIIAKSQSASGTDYRSFIYALYNLFKSGGALEANWAVVGTSGTWTSEASVGPGDYFRIRCTTAWSNTYYQEFLFSYGAAGSVTVGGYTSSAAGIYIVGAPNGSNDWDAVAEDYGGTHETGLLEYGSTFNPATFHVWAGTEAFVIWADHTANGNWTQTGDFLFYGGRLRALDTTPQPWCALGTRVPQVHTTSGWGTTSPSATQMRAYKADASGMTGGYVVAAAFCDNTKLQTATDGYYIGWDILPVVETTTNMCIGLMDIVRRTDRTSTPTAPLINTTDGYWTCNGIRLPW